MSIASEITRLQNAKNDLKTSINSKLTNIEITDELLDEYASFVDQIEPGGEYDIEITLNQDGTQDLNIVDAGQGSPTNLPNEFDLLLTGNYGYMTEEVCSNIIEGNYIYIM